MYQSKSGMSACLAKAMEVALMDKDAKNAEIQKIFKEACKVISKQNMGLTTLFFIPLVFAPSQEKTTLFSRFQASNGLSAFIEKKLNSSVGAKCHVVPRLFKHSEISKFSAKQLSDLAKRIGSGQLEKNVETNEMYVSGLAFIIGAVTSPTEIQLEQLNTREIIETTTSLVALEVTTEIKSIPKVCGFFDYVEALIHGSIQDICEKKEFVSTTDIDENLECVEIKIDLDISESNTSIIIDGPSYQAKFRLDDERIGENGVNRIMQEALKGTTFMASVN